MKLNWIRTLVFAALISAAPTYGQNLPFELVADLAQVPQDFSSSPSRTHAADQQVFFQATDSPHGKELWRSDGTAEGTRLVADLCPGRCDSSIEPLGTIGDRLLFGVSGRLWISDGTDTGTQPLLNPCPGCFNVLQAAASLPDRIVFRAKNPDGNFSLWVSDGTVEGTVTLPEPVLLGSRNFYTELATAGNYVFFPVIDAEGKKSLWRTDGTPAGTTFLKEICDRCFSTPGILTPVGDRLFFSAGDDSTGEEPWVSDGTPGGTRSLGDLVPGSRDSLPYSWVEFENKVYGILYLCDDACIIESDGTPEGTRKAPELYPTDEPMRPVQVHVIGSKLLLTVVKDADNTYELWNITDSDAPQLVQVAEEIILHDFELDGRLIYEVREGTSPARSTWSSDGTAQGTGKLGEVSPSNFAALDAAILFAGTVDPFTKSQDSELWITDGSVQGTRELLEIHRPTSDSNPRDLVAWGEQVVFRAAEEDQALSKLWSTDGTDLSLLLSDLRTSSSVVAGKRLYHIEVPSPLITVFEPEGAMESIDIGAAPSRIAGVGGRLFVASWSPGQALWTTQGTQRETDFIADIQPGWFPGCPIICPPSSLPSFPQQFTRLGSQTLFVAFEDEFANAQLWSTRGVSGDVELVYEFELDPSGNRSATYSSPEHLTAAGNWVYFTAFHHETGRELWVTNGTQEGTRLVADLAPGTDSSGLKLLTAWGWRAAFARYNGTRDELWVAELGARPLATFSDGSRIREIAVSEGVLYVVVFTPELGTELWALDPRESRELRPLDLRPGIRSSGARDLTPIPGGIFFGADDGSGMGFEPWISDGTLAGTAPVGDLYPGSTPSSPEKAVRIGRTLYFAADHPDVGRELFSIDLAETRFQKHR